MKCPISVLFATLVSFLSCNDTNPASTSNSLAITDLAGSWVSVRVHEFGFFDTNGVRESWDSSYSTPIAHLNAMMLNFQANTATAYIKEDDSCFAKYDAIPYTLVGNRINGDYWSGMEIDEDSYLFKWSNTIQKTASGLLLSYIEDESFHSIDENDTSHEVWEYYLEPPDNGGSLDLLANSIQNCLVLTKGKANLLKVSSGGDTFNQVNTIF